MCPPPAPPPLLMGMVFISCIYKQTVLISKAADLCVIEFLDMICN